VGAGDARRNWRHRDDGRVVATAALDPGCFAGQAWGGFRFRHLPTPGTRPRMPGNADTMAG